MEDSRHPPQGMALFSSSYCSQCMCTHSKVCLFVLEERALEERASLSGKSKIK